MNAIIIIEILKFIKICLLVLFRIFNVFYNNALPLAAFTTSNIHMHAYSNKALIPIVGKIIDRG